MKRVNIKTIIEAPKVKRIVNYISRQKDNTSAGAIAEQKITQLMVESGLFSKIVSCSKDVDFIYGADIKITFKDEQGKGVSQYVDLTCNVHKECRWIKNPIGIFTDDIKEANVFSKKSGLKLGLKYSNKYFTYEKPVLVVYVSNPTMVGDDDILWIKDISKDIAYEYSRRMANGNIRKGFGKSISNFVFVDNNYQEKYLEE